MLEAGMTNRMEATVTEQLTAMAMGSGELPVFATPAMAALMEGCAAKCAAPCLEPGQTTVGSYIEVRHMRPTPQGEKVLVECTLTVVEGRRLTFEITAFDSSGEIGRAKHQRAIVDGERFMFKCMAQAGREG